MFHGQQGMCMSREGNLLLQPSQPARQRGCWLYKCTAANLCARYRILQQYSTSLGGGDLCSFV